MEIRSDAELVVNDDGFTIVYGFTDPGTLQDRNLWVATSSLYDGPLSMDEIVSTTVHELGHSADLNHPWETQLPDINQNNENVTNETVTNNVMNSEQNPIPENNSSPGTETTPDQLNSIREALP